MVYVVFLPFEVLDIIDTNEFRHLDICGYTWHPLFMRFAIVLPPLVWNIRSFKCGWCVIVSLWVLLSQNNNVVSPIVIPPVPTGFCANSNQSWWLRRFVRLSGTYKISVMIRSQASFILSTTRILMIPWQRTLIQPPTPFIIMCWAFVMERVYNSRSL